MNYQRAISAAKSTKHRRVAVLVSVTGSMVATAMLLAAPRPSAVAARDLITSMHAAWMRVTAPGMQFPAGRLNPRAVKIWIAGLRACYIPRLNSCFSRIFRD
ncbi:hypothetical protein [Candidatus Binatus sp.]|jgi:hypothetical protein|uniref:hypothetical protein n=1 Tax=Candidatus Binatus sp. TaxID=2811406 RepID=UPI003BCE5AEB